MRRLVVIRPEPGASATAEAARARGMKVLKLPLFEGEPVPWIVPAPQAHDALLVTSANAIRHGGMGLEELKPLPVVAVGGATAEAARSCGFNVRAEGRSGIESLLEQLPGRMRLLHLAGRDRMEVQASGHVIDVVEVYAMRAQPLHDADCLKGKVVALHSARAAAHFGNAADKAKLDRSAISLVTLSAAVAQEAGTGWEQVAVADRPTDAVLLALARTLCL